MSIASDLKVIEDGFGYRITPKDLRFIGVSPKSIAEFSSKAHPLGMSKSEFRSFVNDLKLAIDMDDLKSVDVRLQGSSARFFSGKHKEMLYDRGLIAEHIAKFHLPTEVELDEVENKLHRLWPNPACRPRTRPFDSMHKLGLDAVPSDYDIQISSKQLVERAEKERAKLGIPDGYLRCDHEDYSFIRKIFYRKICPNLQTWSLLQTDSLRRQVSIAAFGSDGPPEVDESEEHAMSSHFKDDDWIIGRFNMEGAKP